MHICTLPNPIKLKDFVQGAQSLPFYLILFDMKFSSFFLASTFATSVMAGPALMEFGRRDECGVPCTVECSVSSGGGPNNVDCNNLLSGIDQG